MNNRISPTVKHVWNVAMYALHNFCWFVSKTTAFHLGQYLPTSLHLLLLKSSLFGYSASPIIEENLFRLQFLTRGKNHFSEFFRRENFSRKEFRFRFWRGPMTSEEKNRRNGASNPGNDDGVTLFFCDSWIGRNLIPPSRVISSWPNKNCNYKFLNGFTSVQVPRSNQ